MFVLRMTIVIPKIVKVGYVVQILQKKQIARETKIAQLESIALLMISIVMMLNLKEGLAQRIQNADGSLVVLMIPTALFNLANIGVQ